MAKHSIIFFNALLCPFLLIVIWVVDGNNDELHTIVSPLVNRELETSVVANHWPSTPQNIFCEAFVYHSQEEKGIDFLDRLAEENLDRVMSDAMAEELVMKVTPLMGAAKQLLQLSLALRAQSPHCELYRGLARETLQQQQAHQLFLDPPEAFAVVDGEIITVDTLSSVLATKPQTAVKTIPNETIIPAFGENAYGILYGNMGTPLFAATYRLLRNSEIPFVVRHMGAVDYEERNQSNATGLPLQGYGVWLDIRNVEYKVFDDRGNDSLHSDDEIMVDLTKDDLDVPPGFLAGVNLTALGLDTEKTLVRKLWSAHHNQNLHSSIIPPVWRRRQLPLQATTAILNSATDPLVTLQQISQNLPSMVSSLVQLEVPDNLRKAVEVLEESGDLRPGLLYINGKPLPIDMASFNLFDILNVIQKEQRNLDEMSEMLKDLPSAALRDVQAAWMNGKRFLEGAAGDNGDRKAQTLRIDVARGWKNAVIYLNDVEKDSLYSRWPTSLHHMRMNMEYGGPPSVRRNLFTLLAVVDPIQDPESVALNLGLQLMQAAYPVRIGLLFVDTEHFQECSTFLSKQGTTTSEPCPIPTLFDTKSKLDISKAKATSQTVHLLILTALRDLRAYPGGIFTYIEYIMSFLRDARSNSESVSIGQLLDFHGKLYQSLNLKSAEQAVSDATTIMKAGDKNDDVMAYGHSIKFAVQRGLKPGMGFVNGRPLPANTADEGINRLFGQEQNHVLSLISHGKITDTSPKSVYAYLLEGDNVYAKIHPLLVDPSSGSVPKFLNLDDSFGEEAMCSPNKMVTDVADQVNATKFVIDGIFDFSTELGMAHAAAFLSVMKSLPDKPERVAYRILPSNAKAASTAICPLFAHASVLESGALQKIMDHKYKSLTTKQLLDKLVGISPEVAEIMLSNDGLCSSQRYLHRKLPADNLIVGNGRIILLHDELVTQSDLEMLLSVQMASSRAVTRMLSPYFPVESPKFLISVARVVALLSEHAESSSRTRLSNTIRDLEATSEEDLKEVLLSWNNGPDDREALKVCFFASWLLTFTFSDFN
jgi:UDP-glucose:glycoprotein glucosyltransferase